jgi:hypothetical protein
MKLKQFREYVASNGNRRQKLNRIENFLFRRFRATRDNNLPVHDIDAQGWTLSQTKVENINDFTASHRWLLNFKKSDSIPSRKMTNFISHQEALINL